MSLMVWLPLTQDAHNQGASSIEVALPTCATLDTTGKVGKCYTSSGAANGAVTSCNFTFSQFSIAAWVRINTRVNNWRCTFKMADDTGKDYIGFGCQNTNGTTLGFHFYKTIDGTNTKIFDKYALTPTIGEWIHLVVTYDGKTATYYKNGIELSHDTVVTAVQNSSAVITKLIMLGSDGTRAAAAVKDSLNDFRLYSHCLSPAEVHEISQGLVLHYKLDDIPQNYSKNNNTVWTNFTLGQYYSTIFSYSMADFQAATGAKNGDKFTWSLDLKATGGTKPIAARVQHYNTSSDRNSVIGNYIQPNQEGRSSITFTVNTAYNQLDFLVQNGNSSSVTNNTTEQYKNTKIQAGDISTEWIPTGMSQTITDSSGYGYNGTIVNTPSLVNSQARYTSNIHFSANNQHIQLPAITYSNFGNSFTIAWWGKRSTHSNMMFWGFSDGNRLNGMYKGTLWNTGDGSNNPIYKPGTTTTITAPTATSWHHYVMVGNGTKSQLYVDGVLYGEAKTYKGLTGTSIWINGWRNHTEYSSTDMDISDFRIYCTALSAADVKSLYEVGARADNKNNMHTYEFIEKTNNNENIGATTINTISLGTHSTSSSSKLLTTYTTTKTPAPSTQTNKLYGTETTYSYSPKINCFESGVYIFTWPTLQGTTKVGSFTSSRWQRKNSSSYSSVSTRYYYQSGRIRICLECYDENDTLLKSYELAAAGSVIQTRMTNSFSSTTISLNGGSKTIHVPLETTLGDYMFLKVYFLTASITASTGSFTVQKAPPLNPVTPQLKRTGSFINRSIDEQNFNENAQINKFGTLYFDNFIEF